MSFVDEVGRLTWKAGNGGDGSISWIRAKRLPKGGPGGGNGGDGGSIFVEASVHLTSLNNFLDKRLVKAQHGARGGSNACRGLNGANVYLQVPVGTLVWDQDTDQLITDVATLGEPTLICRGGRGGKGNIVFSSPSNQAPHSKTEGTSGEERSIRLELRFMADVGLVGFPNAGKSTLFSALTGVLADIGEYPFTTLRPSLGTVSHWHGQWTVADIPGIIEGAHEGKGLGLRFLKHIRRVRVLLFVLELKEDLQEVIHGLDLLKDQLRQYDSSLLQKPMFLVLNKVDAFDSFNLDFFLEKANCVNSFNKVFVLSAQKQTGVSFLKSNLEQFLFDSEFFAQSDHVYSNPVTPL